MQGDEIGVHWLTGLQGLALVSISNQQSIVDRIDPGERVAVEGDGQPVGFLLLHMRGQNLELKLRKRQTNQTQGVDHVRNALVQLFQITHGHPAGQVMQLTGFGYVVQQFLKGLVGVIRIVQLGLHKKLLIRLVEHQLIPGFLRRCVDNFAIRQTNKSFQHTMSTLIDRSKY